MEVCLPLHPANDAFVPGVPETLGHCSALTLWGCHHDRPAGTEPHGLYADSWSSIRSGATHMAHEAPEQGPRSTLEGADGLGPTLGVLTLQ